jgi:hypothetical protein
MSILHLAKGSTPKGREALQKYPSYTQLASVFTVTKILIFVAFVAPVFQNHLDRVATAVVVHTDN